jgi:hypothetical protein
MLVGLDPIHVKKTKKQKTKLELLLGIHAIMQ